MSENEQIESIVFQALAHPIRRTIIRIVHLRSQGVSYTELITELGLPTGKLNYHLEQLRGILEKNRGNYYVLTPFGKKTVEHLSLIEQRTNSDDEKYVRLAALSNRGSLQPIVKAFLMISIALMAVFIALWGYIGYISLIEGAPVVVYVILPVLFAVGVSIMGVLIYALAKTPSWLKRLEQKFFGEP